ncbi:MAG: thiol peroxidase [Elusimicrobiaceae bacterium]
MERKGLTRIHGNPLTLEGAELKLGDKAPAFTLTDNDMNPFSLGNVKGKVVILSCVPSLDTAVCDLETRRFNKEAAGLAGDIIILTVSMDLPFAQKRWCAAAGIDKVKTLSDYRTGEFAAAYGVLLRELHLLARTVFVLDKNGIIRYIEITKNVEDEPDYAAIIKVAKELL